VALRDISFTEPRSTPFIEGKKPRRSRIEDVRAVDFFGSNSEERRDVQFGVSRYHCLKLAPS